MDPQSGLTGFIRTVKGQPEDYELEDFVYIKQPNLWGELGHGRAPALAALAAAGVLLSVDEFATTFFERGAIKATILSTPQTASKRERDRLLAWWKRVANGIKNAFATDVMSSEIKVDVIGEGLGELSDQNLTKEKREDISTAMGVPQSILFSSGVSNRSVREADQLSLYNETIIPDCQLIRNDHP
jgi:phage portal protein BeeE